MNLNQKPQSSSQNDNSDLILPEGISQALTNKIFQLFEKFYYNWSNQFDFKNLPKHIDKHRLLYMLFFYGKVSYNYIPEIDEFNFYPFQTNIFIYKNMNFKHSMITNSFYNNSYDYQPRILSDNELSMMPFIFLFKSQKTPFELIFPDLYNLAHSYLASKSNRYNSLGQLLMFITSGNEEFAQTLQNALDVEDLNPIKIIKNAHLMAKDKLQINGKTFNFQKQTSQDLASSVNFDIDKFERRCDEGLAIFSTNFNAKPSAQETNDQVLNIFSKTINNNFAIIQTVNFWFKNMHNIDNRFRDTEIVTTPFVAQKIASFESVLQEKILDKEEI